MSETFAKWVDVRKPPGLWIGESPGREETRLMSDSITLMEKELHRWDYMTPSELMTRLNRITRREKLNCFIQVADDSTCVDSSFLSLLLAGFHRWERLFGEPHILSTQRAPWRRRVSSVNRRRELSNSTEDDSDVFIEAEDPEMVIFEATTGRPKRVEKRKEEKPFVPPVRVIR